MLISPKKRPHCGDRRDGCGDCSDDSPAQNLLLTRAAYFIGASPCSAVMFENRYVNVVVRRMYVDEVFQFFIAHLAEFQHARI